MSIAKNYPCTQPELYAACTAGWSSCNQYLTKFTDLKPKYTPEYVAARLAEITAVSRIPDRYVRSSRQEQDRVNLVGQVQKCLDKWRLLRHAIEEFWPAQEQDLALKSAGLPYFTESTSQRWESCSSLLGNAEAFISANLDKVSSVEVLGPKYAEDFSADVKVFRDLLGKFIDRQNHAGKDTEDKIKADNKLYADLRSMFKDARILFRNEEALLKLFQFDLLVNRISGVGTAGIKGMVSNGQLPAAEIEGLKLTLAETGEEAQVDEDGAYRFGRVPVGTYTLQVSAPGYKSQVIPSVVVKPGTYSTLNIKLEPDIPEPPASNPPINGKEDAPVK